MNKYQRKLNKLTQIKIKKDIVEISNPIYLMQQGEILRSIELLKQLVILHSKGYYRWNRKLMRVKIKEVK